jgi:hypothetical protein
LGEEVLAGGGENSRGLDALKLQGWKRWLSYLLWRLFLSVTASN